MTFLHHVFGEEGVPQDEEPCIIITQDEFKKAEADDLDPLGGVAY